MATKTLKLTVSKPIGKVSAKLIAPEKPICVLTLAHGAGAGMDHSFMENKKGRPDTPAVAHQTIEAAIKKAEELFPKIPVFASGKSFGGRMSSQYLAANPDHPVKGIIFYGFPLHPAGKPSTDRAE